MARGHTTPTQAFLRQHQSTMLPACVQDSDKALFHMARVGLGSLGVVTEVTLQCVPAHELVEHTYVATSNEVRQQHAQLLRNNKHVRYMWIPYTHDVVVVTNNPLQQVRLLCKLLSFTQLLHLFKTLRRAWVCTSCCSAW